MKSKDLKSKSKQDLETKLDELTKELIKLNSQVATGTTLKSPGQIKTIKKTIARLKTELKTKWVYVTRADYLMNYVFARVLQRKAEAWKFDKSLIFLHLPLQKWYTKVIMKIFSPCGRKIFAWVGVRRTFYFSWRYSLICSFS